MQAESVCFAHFHVYMSFWLTALMHHWLAAHQLTFMARDQTCTHASMGMQKHTDTDTFRAISAYSSCRMERTHWEPFMFCFPMHLLLKSAWSAAYIFVPLCLSLTAQGHLSHLVVTTEQEHDSSKIRPMKTGSLMGQKMKTAKAVL